MSARVPQSGGRPWVAVHTWMLNDPDVLLAGNAARKAGELLGVSRQFVDKLIADGRLAAEFKPGSRHRVVRVADVLELEASRRAGADRIGATIDTLVDAGAEY